MLTVDFARLGLRPGERLLDLGCGGGRHAFEAFRRGARVVALDRNAGDVKDVVAMLAAMHMAGEAGVHMAGEAGVRMAGEAGSGVLAGEAGSGVLGTAVNGDALALPFPTGSFDRVVAAEVLEHVPADGAAVAELARVLRPGGTLAVTVPRWFPERVCWALSSDYHAPAVPDGHVRIYRRRGLAALLREAGMRVAGSHSAHALHSPYWWLKCAVGIGRDDVWAVRQYHRFLVWDITTGPPAVRRLERALDPVLGKSLVVYAEKPGG